MTKTEIHEIAATVRAIIEDDCDEIKSKYQKLFGSLKGFRKFIRKECVEFWSDFDPYLDKEYLDIAWLKVGNKIINLDACWCMIRDGLAFDMSKQND